MSLVIIPQIAQVSWHSKIVVNGQYSASIIAHYHASNGAAMFFGLHTGSLKHLHLAILGYKILDVQSNLGKC